MEVVVDVNVTSTEGMNKAFKKKDDKYREWATQETREQKVWTAAMVPLIISHDGTVHNNTKTRKSFASEIKVDWVGMAQNVLRYNVVIVGRFLTKGAGSRRHGEKNTPMSVKSKMTLLKEYNCKRQKETAV